MDKCHLPQWLNPNTLKCEHPDHDEALERELRLDEERIADQMTADEVRGITAPEY